MQTYCNACPAFRDIPTCTQELLVGDFTTNDPKYVYIDNHTTGYIDRIEATPNISGILTLDLSEFTGTPGHDYELWVTDQDADNIDERLDFVINGVVYSCVSFTFVDVFGTNNVLEAYTSQTLKLKQQ